MHFGVRQQARNRLSGAVGGRHAASLDIVQPVPVVLIGDGPNAELEPLAALIDEEARCHGYRWTDAATIDSRVADLEKQRRAWGQKRMVLIGHGAGGGALALAYAATHPERVSVVGQLSGAGIGEHAPGEDARGYADADLIGWAAGTRCPVYLVHGTADPRPVDGVLRLADRIPLARKRIVMDAGDRPWLDQPDAVRELLAEIIGRSSSRA